MKPRKYRNVTVYTKVNVSSSYHHWFSVGITEYKDDEPQRRRRFTWSFEFGLEPRSMPQYVKREIERQVLDGIRAGSFIWYEVDRDGNERYDNLRYHSCEAVQFIADTIERWHSED
jgi:hypothetical protein